MNISRGYSDPLRSEERSMNPEFAQHEMRDPGLKSVRPHMGGMRPPRIGGGLGGAHMHTMPHLGHYSGTPHFQQGGPAQAPAQDEGDPQDLASPDDELSPSEQQEKQIVLNAMAAMDGQSPDPEADIQAFIQAFGARALADLQQLVESHHREQQGNGEDDEDEEDEQQTPGPTGQPGNDEDEEEEASGALQQAGGGLLHGRGTGQSDEINATTPSGHPVLLSDGEYVIDAGTVAALGDGSTKAGARRLDEMRKQIRTKAYGHDKQVKPMAKGGSAGVVLRLK